MCREILDMVKVDGRTQLKDFARNIYAVSIEMLRELERAASRSGQPVRPEFVTFAKVSLLPQKLAVASYGVIVRGSVLS